MESFPEDLLVGVFPLVFAIDATQPKNDVGDVSGEGHRRGRFDKFVDVMVASLLDDGDASVESGSTDGDRRRSVSLFRPDNDDEYSSDEEDFFDDSSTRKRRQGSGTFSSGIYPGFGRRSATRATSSGSQTSAAGPSSYAKTLAMGQSFFERARIESYGTAHGFPPSKDPEGSKNLVHKMTIALKDRNLNQLKELMQNHPLNGILPAGWLEKHVHALPSVILVVCTVSSTAEEQQVHDKHLFKTIEHLAFSLAPKRNCQIHVVGLMEDNVTDDQGEGWGRAILTQVEDIDESTFAPRNNTHLTRNSRNNNSSNINDSFRVTLLRASVDLESIDAGLPPGPALKRLHESAKEASLSYYLAEARRTKEKLAKLVSGGGDAKRRQHRVSLLEQLAVPPADPLLPLVIRCCIKIGFFYEFQLKHEKSLRFLSEAYRHTCRYYQYLQSHAEDAAEASEAAAAVAAAVFAEEQQQVPAQLDATHESVEVELNTTDVNSRQIDAMWRAAVPPPPTDMVHQCRAVAEWLNLKLLSAGFVSHTESGFTAAIGQWREHQRWFCRPGSSKFSSSIPEWFDWSFVARQRLVFWQLLERHPLSSCVDLDTDNDELIALCSPWRTCLAVAEGFLRLARELDLIKGESTVSIAESTESSTDRLRDPFIGALDSGGLGPPLKEERKVAHREKAFELVLKTISLYEGEMRKEKRGFYAEDSFRESSSSRSGARIFYLAGGILLGMNRHEEALVHLEKATKYARGWRELELAIRKMLIECYEKHTPSHSSLLANESSQTLASMILDSYFNAEMSSQDLRRALGQFSTISGGGSLKWYRESFNDEDPDLPFTFEVTFPENIFATIGDTVKAAILIKSNLDYAVHVNSIMLLSLAGELPISSSDMMRATNASEGSGGGIIIQRNFEIIIETELVLPKDLSIIAADESGNGGELQGVAGKGSFSKSARPRSAGLTSAGGARLLSADQLSIENKVTQGWSLRFLGGKPLKCDGLRIAFYPVQVGKVSGSGDQVPVIELTIDKKKPRTSADIRRTPFEEENYIASAWSRPNSLPLSRGPRSLRVLGPQPQMVISNITELSTDGKVLEGTVNRVVLKLQAGPGEHCVDINFRVSCFSVLISAGGNTKRLVSEEDLSSEAETSVNMKDPKYRTPVLVLESSALDNVETTDCGYSLPPGWTMAETGQGFERKVQVLKGGDATYVQLDFFRPSPTMPTRETGEINDSLCKTDFYVTVWYRKERTSGGGKRRASNRAGRGSQRRGGRAMGRGRGREGKRSAPPGADDQPEPSTDFSAEDMKVAPDDVSLEYSGAIVWSRPMVANFSPGVTVAEPCGIPHPSNNTHLPREAETRADMVSVDGGRIAAKCTLESPNKLEELRTEVVGMQFERNAPESDLKVDLLDSLRQPGSSQLYKSSADDTCRFLAEGSKFTVAYSVDVSINEKAAKQATKVRGPLGAVQVDWLPFPLQLPSEAAVTSSLRYANSHGPLRLEKPSAIRFPGPNCEVHKAPFRAQLAVMPPAPSVASPFQVNYSIENMTALHQTLNLEMSDPMNNGGDSGLLIAGLINGVLQLGPKEKQTVSYTVMATRPGRAQLPRLSVASNRYNTWVIHESAGNQYPLYIFP